MGWGVISAQVGSLAPHDQGIEQCQFVLHFYSLAPFYL